VSALVPGSTGLNILSIRLFDFVLDQASGARLLLLLFFSFFISTIFKMMARAFGARGAAE